MTRAENKPDKTKRTVYLDKITDRLLQQYLDESGRSFSSYCEELISDDLNIEIRKVQE